MRKFIISDIHGFGNVYYSIMDYLDNLSQDEEIELYINGDLIDRGYESADILLDIEKRIKDNKYRIIYLGGNHELLMYQYYQDKINGINSYFNDWYENGGFVTNDGLEEILKDDINILKKIDFIANLKIYHMFDEKINNKKIVLVHAACPAHVKKDCNLTIKDNSYKVFRAVWSREYDPFFPFRFRLGNKNYFTIVGHTPNINQYGFFYNIDGNYLNIDGGCGMYASGSFEYNHFPLVEVCDNYLKILTFNSNNEIIYGNYFDGNNCILYKNEELLEARKYLNNNLKVKKLAVNSDGIVYYK